MRLRRSLILLSLFLLSPIFGYSQGNPRQEKADVLFRDLQGDWTIPSYIGISNPLHGGVFYQYDGGDPDAMENNLLIEMLGSPTNRIGTFDKEGFISSAPFHGAFSDPIARTFADRRLIIQTIQAMENRSPTPIGYPNATFPPGYLDWTGVGGTLQLGNIINLRSDATVEFAYADSGFPIVYLSAGKTIITDPDDFIVAAGTFSFRGYLLPGYLLPRYQMMQMVPAIAVEPTFIMHDASGNLLLPGGASSMTTITVDVFDFRSGPGGLEVWQGDIVPGGTPYACTYSGSAISSQWHTYTSTTDVWTGFGCSGTLSSLPNGQYTLRAIDQAGNYSSGAFSVWTGTGPSSGEKARGGPVPATFGNDNCYVATSTDLAVGIQSASLSIDGVGLISSRTFACAAAVKFGPFCRLSAGSYTTTFTNCASTSWQLKSTATAAALSLQACGTNPESQTICGSNAPTAAQLLGMSSFTVRTVGGGFPAQDIGRMCLGIATSALGEDQPEMDGCSVYDGSNNNVERRIVGPADWWAGTGTFRVWNANPGSTQTISANVEIAVSLYDLNGNLVSAATTFTSGGVPYSLDPGEAITGSVSLSEAGQVYPRSTPGGVFKSSFTIKNINVASAPITEPMWDRIRRRELGISASAVDTSGSEVAFTSAAPISFTYTDTPSSIVTDTATLKIYRWTGVDWDSSAVSGLLVSKDAGSGVILASGTAVRTGVYAAMFDGRDSSAPVMSWGIKGSSYGYGGTTFISTFSYLALSSTDPVVNYYNSGVATTYYRIDGLLGDAYAVYSTSLSFLPGTHWVDSYATDYAGNVSSVTRATVTVTAGSVSKFTSSLQVDGNLLVGFLGSGAKAEVVARAEYTYALMVSSVDGRVMLAVDNANFASIGTAPASGRLTLAGVAGDAALALRSGNSTVAVTGAQLAFGYDGTSDLRHALYTQHGSADYNNKLVFKLWTPATGSSSTLGNLAVLSLEGSSKTASGALVHIMPAGLGENELVVSNGSGLGLGNVLRWERWQPSDAKLKTGIERLGAKDEAKAWKDLMSLKPARYRRKANGPAAPLERGYILEEVPQTFRMGSGISVDERLVSVELALKGAIAEMDALEERLKKLRAGRR